MKNIKTLFLALTLVLFLTNNLFSQLHRWYPVSLGTTQNLNSVSSLYISGNNGTVFYKPSNTIPWTSVSSGTTNNLLCDYNQTGIKFIGAANGVILRISSITNFQVVNTGTSNEIRSIGMTLIGSVIRYTAVGTNGMMQYSTNLGANWNQITPVISDNLNSIVFGTNAQRKYGWIAADNGKIMLTTNYGDNWNIVNTGFTNNLKSIYFLDSLKGFAVGSGGIALRTTNGGWNWTNLNLPVTSDLNSISFNSNSGYIAGNNGLIMRTSNTGNSWTINISGTSQNLNSIVATENENAYAVGNNGIFLERKGDPLYHPLRQFRPNNIRTYVKTSGIFNQNTDLLNRPGFEWPFGSGNYSIYTSGLTIAAMVNNELRMAAASYTGEYKPGYINSNGQFVTNDSIIKIYIVSKSDTANLNQDWMNWGAVVPFGAPYTDVNGNFQYDPLIDTPGVKNASQTIFCVMSDANPQSHTSDEGFGGGTPPLNAEIRLTAWGYNTEPFDNALFYKWDIINKSSVSWNATHFSIYNDGELGDPNDNYLGCDTLRDLSFVYNGDNEDADYGVSPPAVGTMFLRTPENLGMTSMTYHVRGGGAAPPPCIIEADNPVKAYNYMRGFKNDMSPFLIPNTTPPQITKYVYSGDPETNQGWTEAKGSVDNCNGQTGTTINVNPPGIRRQIMSTGADNLSIQPNQKITIVAAQFIERFATNLRSVTKLKETANLIKSFYETVDVKNISGVVPSTFELFQNYPNPFNPNTVIKFNLPKAEFVKLRVFDITGREIAVLLNQKMDIGAYKLEWNGTGFSSGVYFYKLETANFTDTKKMVLLK